MKANIKSLFLPGEYAKYVKKNMPKSKVVTGIIKAFTVGGGICTFGEVLREYTKTIGFDNDMTAAFTSIVLIGTGAFLTACGMYDVLGKFAGAGSIIPITGFANSVVAPAMEYKHEGYIMGVGAKLFTVAGPVLVYGFTASLAAGIWYLIFGG